MNSRYETLKSQLLQIKNSLDDNVKRQGIVKEIIPYEQPLDEIYNEISKLKLSPQDKRFVSFNYYSAKSYIFLAKGWKYKACLFFLQGLKIYLEYLKNIFAQSTWSLNYYCALGNFISKEDIELFGNTKDKTFNEILKSLEEVISTFKNASLKGEIRESFQELITNLLFEMVHRSSEIYTQNHLQRAHNFRQLIDSIEKDVDNVFKGILESVKFILLKRFLHFHLRKLIRVKKCEDNYHVIQKEIENILEEMEKTSNLEYKFLKKYKGVDERMNFKIFLAELDKLSVEYYKNLWIFSDFIKVFKALEQIFSHIRKNIHLIYSYKIFSHFVMEYQMLLSYYKLLLLSREFENLARTEGIQSWQKEIASKITKSLQEIAERYYKYRIPAKLERQLAVIEKSVSGKFLEFVIFYLLKEFVEKNIEIKKHLRNISDTGIQELFQVISNLRSRDGIKWSYKIKGMDSDVDVFIKISDEERYGLFVKSGILNKEDLKKIHKEISLAEQIELSKIFIIIDIAKNLQVVNQVKKRNNSQKIILMDIGLLLQILLNIAKREKSIEFELSKSGVLAYAGFYS